MSRGEASGPAGSLGTPPDLCVLATGGTIDKVYSTRGRLEVADPAAAELLRIAGVDMERVEVVPVLRKDSLDMDESDRHLIADRLDETPRPRVVITHGTDTMTDTADYLAVRRDRWPESVIVLTGAMRPAAMAVSDAAFNLGAAVGVTALLPPGVYVCMGGAVFPAGTVRKDRERGRFVARAPAEPPPSAACETEG